MGQERIQSHFKPERKNSANKLGERMEVLMREVVEEAERIEIKPSDKNENNELLVSPGGPVSNLGKRSELWYKIVRTESFKKFFGDWQNDPNSSSKIVDKNGEPLVLFRGVAKDLSVDDFYNEKYYRKKRSWDFQTLGKGLYATPSPSQISYDRLSYDPPGNQESMFSMFVNSRKPKYKPNFLDQLVLGESVNNIILFIERRFLKFFSQISLGNYDSVFSKYYSNSVFPKIEDLYAICIKDPRNVLIIPSPVKKPEDLPK